MAFVSRDPSQRGVVVRAGDEVRGTQSFVQVMAAVWRRPVLTAMEIAWRWVFGAMALWLLLGVVQRLLRMPDVTMTLGGVQNAPWADPMAASVKVGEAMAVLLTPTLMAARWLVPTLFVAWVVVSAAGRVALLRRLDAKLQPRFVALAALGAVRLLFFGATMAMWFAGLTWAGSFAITGPAGRGQEPNLVMYFGLVIVQTLLLFIAWAAASWVLSIAPMLSMLRGLSVGQSLRQAWSIGPLRGKLIEINLVMGIVKVALVVLAMVFSASPLPFETVASQGFLQAWWIGVTVLYLVASDYFHVVRLAAYLALWRAYDSAEIAPGGKISISARTTSEEVAS